MFAEGRGPGARAGKRFMQTSLISVMKQGNSGCTDCYPSERLVCLASRSPVKYSNAPHDLAKCLGVECTVAERLLQLLTAVRELTLRAHVTCKEYKDSL